MKNVNKLRQTLIHISFFAFQNDTPLPEDDEGREKRTDDISPWDQEFLRVEQPILFDLILVQLMIRPYPFKLGNNNN